MRAAIRDYDSGEDLMCLRFHFKINVSKIYIDPETSSFSSVLKSIFLLK